jgi:rod shape-determining protein MreC
MRERGVSKSKFVRAIVVLVILFGIALLDPAPLSGTIRGVFHTVFWPFEKAFSSASSAIRDFSSLLSSIGDLKHDNERLSEENARLVAENATLVFLRGENESLRRDAGLEIRKKFDLTTAEIIASGGEARRGSVVVDRGSVHGIQVGMPAIIGEGLLVGIVDEVYPVSSTIALVTDSKTAIGGITAENGSKGIIRGDRGLGILYGMVLQSDALKDGDRVMTSGTGSAMPSGLYVGSIGTVRDSADRLFREASIVSPVDFDRLRFLFIVRSDADRKL